MNVIKTQVLCACITFPICTSYAATTTWYDSDFSSPKGHTWINSTNPTYGGDVHIANTTTAHFAGASSYSSSLLNIESGGKLVADNHVESTQYNGLGHAVLVTDGGKAYFNGGLTVTNVDVNNNAFALAVGVDHSELHVVGETIVNPSTYGIGLTGKSINSFDGLVTINASATGLQVSGSQNHFKQGLLINMNGDGAWGINVQNQTSSTIIDDHLTINMEGNGSIGILGNSPTSATPQTIDFTVNGPLSINLKATSNNTQNLYGVAVYQNHDFKLKDTTIIFDDTYTSNLEIGLYASAGSIDIDGNLTIQTTAPADQYAIYATNGGNVSMSGVADIAGFIYANGNTTNVSLDMQSGSMWEGASKYVNNATIDIAMDNSTWKMLETSFLTKLDANNNSNIIFSSSNNNFMALNTEELQGSGSIFSMNVNLGGITASPNADGERVGVAGTDGDLLVVSNTMGNGQQYLSITNDNTLTTQGNEVLQVVATPTNNAGNVSLAHVVEAGGYEYGLRQSQNAANQTVGWELYGLGRMSSTTQSTLNHLNIGYLLNYIDTQTLLQRMGDLRENNKQQPGGFWMRAYTGRTNSFSGQGLDGFNMSYSGTQLGIDKQIELTSGTLYTGLMVGYTKADPDYQKGSGTAKHITTGLYATYLHDNGIYIDAIAKYSNIRNDFSVADTTNQLIKGKTQSDGYGLSLESGKRFAMGKTNFYVEPQVQVSYQYQQGDKARATNGLNIHLSNYDSLLGRASAVVGYKLSDTENSQFHVYAKAGVVKEFSGDTHYTINNGKKQKYSFKGHWLDGGIGVTGQINQRHHIYGELDYSDGSRFNRTQFSVGYRYQF